ncbi:DUF4019 domain-containing protein [Erythrobacter aquimaris]|uniref:DUF4019 domain-containing protein n=1 Tax=Qipengyuania aquimaris TaxID=255984 RepID=A0A6I4TMY3_9SPHN|nr:DUF4019 domain-containing protein [Qipengyuania aquimaris]MXO97282.1 DUF4019 domain-containing protein [Qipengyuania aquimaris]
MSDGVASLTDREREVLRLLLAGHTAKTIAIELDLSVHTVNDYLREARKKLGVSTSREAARILGDTEAQAPSRLGAEQIGMPQGSANGNTPTPSQQPGGRSYLPWIIGGILMFAAAIAAVLILSSTGTTEAVQTDTETSAQDAVIETAARNWVRLIDDGDYAESWAQAGPTFKSAVTAETWAAKAAPVREPLGALVSRTVETVSAHSALPGAPDGQLMIITFATDFAEASSTTETVVMSLEEGRWGVVGYFIK